jgi:uncharacterized membrane protein
MTLETVEFFSVGFAPQSAILVAIEQPCAQVSEVALDMVECAQKRLPER